MKGDFYICNRTVERRWITKKLLLSRLVFGGRHSQGHHNSPWSVGIKPQSDAFLWENERQKGLGSSGSRDSEYSNSFNQAVEKFRVETMEVRNLFKKNQIMSHMRQFSFLLSSCWLQSSKAYCYSSDFTCTVPYSPFFFSLTLTVHLPLYLSLSILCLACTQAWLKALMQQSELDDDNTDDDDDDDDDYGDGFCLVNTSDSELCD